MYIEKKYLVKLKLFAPQAHMAIFGTLFSVNIFLVSNYQYFLSFFRSHSSHQQRHSSSPYLNSRQRSTSESEPHPQPPPRTKTSKAKLKKASTELQAVKLNRSMSESNVIASLRYGRSDDDNDMEVSTKTPVLYTVGL